MQDLRLLAIEHEFVVLEGANGEQYRLALDDALRKAIKSDRSAISDTNSISPREIQELVRSGNSVDEIVTKTGAAYSYVEKFAIPVLEELEHIISSAKSVRLAFLGDRYGETNHVEFGVLIRERLEQMGASDVQWIARRSETGGNQVTCSFVIDGSKTEAKWAFDLRHLSLSPDNEVALNLGASPKPDSFFLKARPKPVLEKKEVAVAPDIAPYTALDVRPDITPDIAHTPAATQTSSNLTANLPETQEFAEIIPFGRSRNNTANVPVVAAGTSAELDEEPTDFDAAENLLETLRKRRDLRESKTGVTPILSNSESQDAEAFDGDGDFDSQTVWIEADTEVFIDEDNQDYEASQEPQEPQALTPEEQAPAATQQRTPPAAKSSSKRGRTAMPSWDEIVFGTKPDARED